MLIVKSLMNSDKVAKILTYWGDVNYHLNLSLQGLNIVDDLVKHYRLSSDLNSVHET